MEHRPERKNEDPVIADPEKLKALERVEQARRIVQHSEAFNQLMQNSVLLDIEVASYPDRLPKPIRHIIEDVADVADSIGATAERLDEMADEHLDIIEQFKDGEHDDEQTA